MSEHTDQTTVPAGAVPARIQLDDFIEAVTRGVARALAAQDEVSGYILKPGERPMGTGTTGTSETVFIPRGGATTGLIFNFNLLSS